ncbi:hypothetical protein J6P68_03180 [bacterium]|nr:hypothetical protein [bacterium]
MNEINITLPSSVSYDNDLNGILNNIDLSYNSTLINSYNASGLLKLPTLNTKYKTLIPVPQQQNILLGIKNLLDNSLSSAISLPTSYTLTAYNTLNNTSSNSNINIFISAILQSISNNISKTNFIVKDISFTNNQILDFIYVNLNAASVLNRFGLQNDEGYLNNIIFDIGYKTSDINLSNETSNYYTITGFLKPE